MSRMTEGGIFVAQVSEEDHDNEEEEDVDNDADVGDEDDNNDVNYDDIDDNVDDKVGHLRTPSAACSVVQVPSSFGSS